MRNIVLTGFMGTGKSTVGKRLAKLLAWDFVDTDWEIEEVTGLSVPEIFRRYGETRFRSEESLVVQRLCLQEQLVIATGGGTILNPTNWEALAQNGIVITLYAPLDVILDRVGYRNDRPLLKGSQEAIQHLWTERQDAYAKADFTVDTTQRDVEEVVQEILLQLGRRNDGFINIAKD